MKSKDRFDWGGEVLFVDMTLTTENNKNCGLHYKNNLMIWHCDGFAKKWSFSKGRMFSSIIKITTFVENPSHKRF